jgi:hypothetical protein
MDQEPESGHFYFGENRTSVLCSDINLRGDGGCSSDFEGSRAHKSSAAGLRAGIRL